MGAHKEVLLGTKFGKITIIKRVLDNKYSRVYYEGECECGKIQNFRLSHLKDGSTISCGCIQRKAEGESSFNAVYSNYKQHAELRGYKFLITKEKFKEVSQQNCYYDGTSPSNLQKSKHNTGDFIYNGLDRVDNTKDYTEDNVVSCCFQCNRAKDTYTKEEFLEWVERTYNHSIVQEVI